MTIYKATIVIIADNEKTCQEVCTNAEAAAKQFKNVRVKAIVSTVYDKLDESTDFESVANQHLGR